MEARTGEELLYQLKTTRKMRKGKEGQGIYQQGRVYRWKTGKENIVREKKKNITKDLVRKMQQKMYRK